MSPRVRPLAGLLLALTLLGVGAAPAAAKPVVCKKGFGKLVLQGKARCVPVAKLVPKPAAAPSAYARWMRIALDRQLGAALEKRFVKPRLRGRSELRAASVLTPLRARSAALGAQLEGKLDIESLRVVRSPLAATTTNGPVTISQSGNTASVHGSMTSRDAAAGTTSTLDVTGRVTVDPATGREVSSEIEFGAGVKTDGGRGFRIEIAIPMTLDNDVVETCPTADGAIKRKGKLKLRRTTKQTKPSFGVEFINESITVNATSSFTGKVDADAKLSTITYDIKVNLEYAFSGSALLGIIRSTTLSHFNVAATGTLNTATGAVAAGNVSITGDHRANGLSSAEAAAEFAKAIADPAARASLERMVASFIKTGYDGLKEAEKHWQTPNACAKLELSPTTATLAEDETAAVDGTVKASDGAPADGKWSAKTVARGSVTTLPGTSAKTAPIKLTMKGAAPDAANHAVDVTLRATSPAGVAEGPWVADAAANTLYFRVTAASGTQQAGGKLEATNGCTYNVAVPPDPWAYSFSPTTGPPDGTLEIEFGFVSGSVRASGTSVAPAIDQERICPMGGTTVVHRAAITYNGKFGPSLGFGSVAGDPTKVTVFWDMLSPPPLLDVEMIGPDCRRQGSTAGTPFETIVPLATLRGRAPFTLTTAAPWTVDVTNILGHTTCSGTTSQSLTLQRVNADGSPLG
jgi:hypothetical protein